MGKGEVMTTRDYADRMWWIKDDIQTITSQMYRIASDLEILTDVADRELVDPSLYDIVGEATQVRKTVEDLGLALGQSILSYERRRNGG